MLTHSHALSSVISTEFALSPSRVETFTRLVCGVLSTRTVNLAQIAAHDPGRAKVSSAMRRNQRFFEKVELSSRDAMQALVRMSGLKAPYQLCLDRTNWQFGKTNINYLVLSITTKTMRIPVLWKLIASQANSNTQDWIELIDTWISSFGADSINLLLADREFVSNQWFDALVARNVPFCIRVKEGRYVSLDDGRCMRLKTLASKLQTRGKLSQHPGKLGHMKAGFALRFAAKKPRKGDMIVVACHGIKAKKALALYKQRWRIETMFADWKTRGLNIEDTHLRCPKKLSLLLMVVAIAALWAQRLVQLMPRAEQPKKAGHGYLRKSWFRAGWDKLRAMASQNPYAMLESWRSLWKTANAPNTMRVV